MILQNDSRHLLTNPQRLSMLLGGVVVGELNVGICDSPTLPTDEKPVVTAREPILIDAAPEELKRLIADGKVTVAYDSDPEIEKARRGWAEFNLLLKQTFRFKPTKSQKQNGRQLVKAVVTKISPTIELTHLIRLPASFPPEICGSCDTKLTMIICK